MIRLSAMSLSSSDSVRDLDISQRGCLFPDEQPPGVPLKFYSQYSHHTCIFECALTLAADIEGCTPWYLPRQANSTMCDPWQASEFTKLLEKTNSSQCGHCLPDCEATTYSSTTSSTQIRRCDSRNLNLNPFCSLDAASKLAPSMLAQPLWTRPPSNVCPRGMPVQDTIALLPCPGLPKPLP